MMVYPTVELEHVTTLEIAPTAQDKFGIDTNRYVRGEKKINRTETLISILQDLGASRAKIGTAVEKSKEVFDLRKMRAGEVVHVYRDILTDSARMFVYKPAPDRYVVIDLRDSVSVFQNVMPITVSRSVVAATIESSPYEALTAIGSDPSLAMDLARIFAWQIDFYHIQQGDQFGLAVEQQIADGEVLSTAIHGSYFIDAENTYYAVHFDPNGDGGYYDENGRTLRRAFLKAPLEYIRISSGYSRRRFHPVLKSYRAHLGTDYAAPKGTPIVATSAGTVENSGYTRGNGNYVKIRHTGPYATGYLHMSRIAKGIRKGTRVRQGQVIGYVGSTGLATGPHVCYRFWKNGTQVDPLRLTMPQAVPIAARYRAAFEVVRDSVLAELAAPD